MSAANTGSGSDDSQRVRVQRNGAVAHLRFNRPALLNAIDLELAIQFRQACEHLAADDAVRVVIVSGAGRAFMAGGDVAAMHADPGLAAVLIEQMHAGLRLLAGMRATVIASVHGQVAGGGLGVALACDLCVAAEGTRFTMAYPLIGVSSDCGTSWSLARLVGQRKALEIALLSEPVDAGEALRLGLVNRVFPLAELADRTNELATRLAQGAPIALGHLKRLVRGAQDRSFTQQMDLETEAFVACARTADFEEGAAAFLDKRRPQFKGT